MYLTVRSRVLIPTAMWKKLSSKGKYRVEEENRKKN